MNPESTTISPRGLDPARGSYCFDVTSPCLGRTVTLEVLLPHAFSTTRRYRTLYVLPVDVGIGGRWGDSLIEARSHDLANSHDLICVFPSFDTMPWYNDHPSNTAIRHETFLTTVLVPFIDSAFPTIAHPDARLLLGFSKSGFGAWSLLMRHPDLFGFAAAWDAPLMMTPADLGKYDSGPQFGTSETLARYLPSHLARSIAPSLRPRLVLAGSDNFAHHTEQMHALLESLRILHAYRPDLAYKHHWQSGWLKPLADELVTLAATP